MENVPTLVYYDRAKNTFTYFKGDFNKETIVNYHDRYLGKKYSGLKVLKGKEGLEFGGLECSAR